MNKFSKYLIYKIINDFNLLISKKIEKPISFLTLNIAKLIENYKIEN